VKHSHNSLLRFDGVFRRAALDSVPELGPKLSPRYMVFSKVGPNQSIENQMGEKKGTTPGRAEYWRLNHPHRRKDEALQWLCLRVLREKLPSEPGMTVLGLKMRILARRVSERDRAPRPSSCQKCGSRFLPHAKKHPGKRSRCYEARSRPQYQKVYRKLFTTITLELFSSS
jgi:hypothetical protein